ncbi:hypothetical protein QL285_021080 [Trifolium repens]|nr:hypothetical protein QL285_021080 [Trifolium repens]
MWCCGSVLGFYSFRCDLVLGELFCFGSGVIGLFRSSGGDLVSYGVLFRRGMRWWQPARMMPVAGGDWRLFWCGGWRVLAMDEFCYSGGSFDCVSFRPPPPSLEVVVGGMEIA